MPSEPKFKIFLRKCLVLVPWAALAAFASIYFKEMETPGILFSIFLPLLLAVYAAHEICLDSPSLPWIWGIFAVLLPLIFFHPSHPGVKSMGGMTAAWLLIGCAVGVASLLFKRLEMRAFRYRDKIEEISQALKSKIKENNFYQTKIQSLKLQIGERQRLAAFAREMGTLLDPALIRQTLIEKTKKLFPEDQISLHAVLAEDPVDAWVGEHKNSILIKDSERDKRMTKSGPKSVVAAPLVVSRKLIGVLRADSLTANRFAESDLQQLEVYSSLAILALENAQLFSQVNALATQDSLTGLATHRVFQERLAEELLRGARYHTPVSLIMADVDHFKLVNDNHGHLAGDEVLKEMGRVLLSRLRPVDFAARYGGEEFCLILPGLGIAQASVFAESLRKEIESLPIYSAGRTLSVTASFGCSAFPDDAQIASQVLRKADERMYKAKTSGRNRVVSA